MGKAWLTASASLIEDNEPLRLRGVGSEVIAAWMSKILPVLEQSFHDLKPKSVIQFMNDEMRLVEDSCQRSARCQGAT